MSNEQTTDALIALIREHFPDIPVQISEPGEATIRIQRESYPFRLTLTRGTGETLESYLARCQDVANYAGSKVPSTSTAVTFDVSDTSRYTQVGEHAYEIVTPGHQPIEETGNERDTHFAGFAKLLTQELWDQGYLNGKPYVFENIMRPYIETLIARRAYDLMQHTFDWLEAWESHQMLDHSYNWEHLFEQVPDMTAWPEKE